ncbi:MAG: hypothetical protein ACM3SQ_02855 [Betaproteobacteria bacterium]
MRVRVAVVTLALAVASLAVGRGQEPAAHRNPIVELLKQHKPVFGLYTPSARPFGRRGVPPPATPPKSPAELAEEALSYGNADFLFNGSMEGGVDRAIPEVRDLMAALERDASSRHLPFFGLTRPLMLKSPKIAPDAAGAVRNIGRELDLGAAGIMFVETESVDEVRQGLAAMRFKSNGGTRPDMVGAAPAYWGMSEQQYRKAADVWPLNPDGELINWTIVESKEGLAHVREIAAVKGIGVLWPGAGTLRGVFTTTNEKGERVFDAAAHEAAIQQVLAACKEFNVPCGYPANAGDIAARMQQGFSVFVMPWGEQGFKAVEIGRRIAGR